MSSPFHFKTGMSKKKIEEEIENLILRKFQLYYCFPENKQWNKLNDAVRLAEEEKDARKWQKMRNKVYALEKTLVPARQPEIDAMNDKIKELKSML